MDTIRTAAAAPAPHRRRAVGLLALLGAVLGLMLAAAGPASAHAQLEKSDPAQGAVVKAAPGRVVLTFSEGVTLQDDAVKVFAPNGKRVDSGAAGHASGAADTAQVALKGGLPQGTFTVSWKAVSADTHPVGGAFTFSIGHASASTAVPGEKPQVGGSGTVEALYGVARGVAYAGFTALVGAAAFAVLVWPRAAARRGMQRLLQGAWAVLLVSTVAVLLLYGPHTAGGGIGRAFSLSLVRTTLGTRLGEALGLRLLGLAAFAVWLSVLAAKLGRSTPPAAEPDAGERELREERERDTRWALGLTGGLLSWGLAATWAAADHAAVGIQAGLALPLDLVHLMAAALWLGGLASLITVLTGNGGHDVPQDAVARFSRIAFWCVAALAVTGVYQGWRQTGSWHALFDTRYGLLLMIKAGCVAVLVGAAAASRRWTRQLRERDPEPVLQPETETAVHTGSVPPDAKRRAQLERQRAARRAAVRGRADRIDPAPAMLRRSVLAEAGIAVLVLAVTTLLTNTAPGRDAAAAAGPAARAPQAAGSPSASLTFDTGGEKGKGKVAISVEPGTTGRNTVHVQVSDPGGRGMDVAELDLAFTLKGKGIGPIKYQPEALGGGHYAVSNAQLPMAGRWTVDVTVRTSAIDEVTDGTAVTVR